MQPKLRLIKQHRCGRRRLQQSSREANESKSAVRELSGPEWVVGILLPPLKLNQFGIVGQPAKQKIIEEWRGQPYGIANLLVALSMRFLNS